jgi:propanol-preferring alcohol dehydrogenase
VVVPFRELVFRNVRIHGSLLCSPNESKEMLEVVSKHNITVSKSVFNGINEIPKLIELSKSGKMSGKGMVVIDPEQIEEEKETDVQLV